MKGVVSLLKWESDDVFSLHLKLDSPMDALPGKFVLISLANSEAKAYSIVSSTNNNLQLGIKKGLGTSKLLSELSLGDSLTVDGPFGTFTPRKGSFVVLIGGGIGVTPLVSLYKYYVALGVPVKVLLSSRNNFVFNEQFDSPLLFDTTKDRRIHVDDIPLNSLVYICGPPNMIDSLRMDLLARGYNAEHIFSEDFS